MLLFLATVTAKTIKSLSDQNTFTVTTGHQLNLMGGPLYFLYKIITTINLAKELKSKYPQNNFIPETMERLKVAFNKDSIS